MTRRLLNLVTALSLLLCAAVAALWVRSSFAEDRFCWTTTTRRVGVDSSLGRVKVWERTLLAPSTGTYGAPGGRHFSDRASRELQPDVPGGTATGWNPVGIGAWSRVQGQGRFRVRGILAPYWLPVVLFALLPAHWAWGIPARRVGRTRSGLCPACGYDLRATPDRCPECGETRPAAASH